MAFQIADDIGDLEQDKEKGRTINMALAFGVDAAKEMLDKEVKEYKEGLRKLKIDSPELLFLGDVVK